MQYRLQEAIEFLKSVVDINRLINVPNMGVL